LQLQRNYIGEKSRQRCSSLPLTLIGHPVSFSDAQLFEIQQQTATGAQGSYCYMRQSIYCLRYKTLRATTYKQKEIEGNYIPPIPGLLTKEMEV